MIKNSAIEFTVWEKDEALEIQLEPECYLFKIMPGDSIKFVAVQCLSEFEWSVRIDHREKSIQLFPESKGSYEIEIYENGVLLHDWLKYMM
jgi:hypothetical protein